MRFESHFKMCFARQFKIHFAKQSLLPAPERDLRLRPWRPFQSQAPRAEIHPPPPRRLLLLHRGQEVSPPRHRHGD